MDHQTLRDPYRGGTRMSAQLPSPRVLMSLPPVIVWFRQDLRLADHPALTAAAQSGQPVLPLYILDDTAPGPWKRGRASRWWLHHSLEALSADLAVRGSRLTLRRGGSVEVLADVIAATGATSVYTSRCYEPWAGKLETEAHARLADLGVELKRYAGNLLFDPDRVRTKTGEVYKVYTPFWRTVSAMDVRSPLPAPKILVAPAKWPKTEKLAAFDLLPTKPDWSGTIRQTWTPGSAPAAQRLTAFLDEAVGTYGTDRNRPDKVGTSRLSPHLHFGEISTATCWHATKTRMQARTGADKGAETFMKELVWREFSYSLLHHWPDLPETPFRKDFANFPWQPDTIKLQAWQKGLTGFPIVDAGMRELWATGWMHNRVRMIVGSFLVKDLLISWTAGEAWFWDCLVDADLASNAASWQWIAGSGADAAPYFRVFNPQKQGETFDPDGAYVRKWIPEIKRLPNNLIHAPQLAPPEILQACDITLGKTYPRPIVDHTTARNKALAALAKMKASTSG
jgi:deoxyribodipyrimidine photo-lyase